MSTQKYGCLSETYSNYPKCLSMCKKARNILLYFLKSLDSIFILLMFQAKAHNTEQHRTTQN